MWDPKRVEKGRALDYNGIMFSRIFTAAVFLLLSLSSQSPAAAVYRAQAGQNPSGLEALPRPGGYEGSSQNRLEALPPPGQLQPIPRPPQLRQPNVPPPPPMPAANRGAINPRTGEFFLPHREGVINPRTGEYYPPAGTRGFFNPKTGEFYPRY